MMAAPPSAAVRIIVAREIEEWLYSRTLANDHDLSPQTAVNARAILHAFFAWLLRQKLIDFNPVEAVPKPKVVRGAPAWVHWVRWVHRCRYAAVATGRFTTILQWQRKKDCYFEPLSILARGLSLIALALSLVALSLVALSLVALSLVALSLVALSLVALSLVALTLVALTLVALSLVALTLVALTLVALIAAISLVSTSSRCLLSRCLLSRCLLSRCLLSRCLLSRCLLSRCLLSRCLLSRCLLGRCLLGAGLLGCKLLRGNVIGGRDGTCGLPSLCRHSLGWQTSRLSQKIIQTGQEST